MRSGPACAFACHRTITARGGREGGFVRARVRGVPRTGIRCRRATVLLAPSTPETLQRPRFIPAAPSRYGGISRCKLTSDDYAGNTRGHGMDLIDPALSPAVLAGLANARSNDRSSGSDDDASTFGSHTRDFSNVIPRAWNDAKPDSDCVPAD